MSIEHIKEIISTEAPGAVGSYSQAVIAGKYVFVSGQIPIDPVSGEMIKGSIKDEAGIVFTNAETILKECGLTLRNVVKSEIFLMNISDFEAVNEVYSSKFTGEVLPARHVIEVANLPKGARIEFSCTAFMG